MGEKENLVVVLHEIFTLKSSRVDVNKIAWSRFYVSFFFIFSLALLLYTIFILYMWREDNAVILRGFVCLMCHLKHFYANKDIKLSFGKVANCFMIFSLSEKKGERKKCWKILRLFIHDNDGAH
jgi:hypothetical protein